jgi:hypothetical protein
MMHLVRNGKTYGSKTETGLFEAMPFRGAT